MLLSKNIFCAWILRELNFFIPKEIIILIVSNIKVKIKTINNQKNILIVYDKSIGIFDPKTNKFNFRQLDLMKKVFLDHGSARVITKSNEICRFESGKISHIHATEDVNHQNMYNFLKKNGIKGIKKIYYGYRDMKIILTKWNKLILVKTIMNTDYFKMLSLGSDESKIKKIAIPESMILVLTMTNLHYFPREPHDNVVQLFMFPHCNIIVNIKMTRHNIFTLDIHGNVVIIYISRAKTLLDKKLNISNVNKMYCGDHYCFFLTKNNELYGYGSNIYGKLGNGKCDDAEYTQLHMYEGLYKINLNNVVSISVCENYCTALTLDGGIYMWGNICEDKSGITTNDSPSLSNVPYLVFKIKKL